MAAKLSNTIMVILMMLGIYSCTDDNRLAGGGTDTEVSILAGMVTNNGNPVDGATVMVDNNSSWQGDTDTTGFFSISNVPYGKRSIYVYKQILADIYEGMDTVMVESKNMNVGTISLYKKPPTPAKRTK
jgi:hypothetical protein